MLASGRLVVEEKTTGTRPVRYSLTLLLDGQYLGEATAHWDDGDEMPPETPTAKEIFEVWRKGNEAL
jgi:hypothetical protein